ncbi:MAG: hypothetical protein AAF901_06970, partial [Bacteroidota bacterium]
ASSTSISRLGAAKYDKSGLTFETQINEGLIRLFLQNKTDSLIESSMSRAQQKVCDYVMSDNSFFINAIPGWKMNCEISQCDGESFDLVWSKGQEKFAIDGVFEDSVPRIKHVDFGYLQKQLNTHIDSLVSAMDSDYISVAAGYFQDDRFEVPLYVNIAQIADNQKIGTISVTLQGKISFEGTDWSDVIFSKIESKIKEFFTAHIPKPKGLSINLLDQEITIYELVDVSIRAKSISFKGGAKLFGNFDLCFTININDGDIQLNIDEASYSGLKAHLSANLGIAAAKVIVEPSIMPLGLKGTAFVNIYGFSVPPFNFLLTKDDFDYELATSFVLPGVWPIAPEVVAIDPRLTFFPDQQMLKGEVVITVGASEEARATARIIKLNAFLELPFKLSQEIVFGGDLVLCTVLPLMTGRGEINIKKTTFDYRTETTGFIKWLIDYQQHINFNGKRRTFKGTSSIEVLGIVGAGVSLEASIPDGKYYIFMRGSGYARLPVAQFNINAQTKVIPGPLAIATAAMNAQVGFDLVVGKELLGVSIAEILGEASIHQARFNVEVLGLGLGVVLPGPASFTDGHIIEMLVRMFDLNIDIAGLLRVPDLEEFLNFNAELSLNTRLGIGGIAPGKIGSGGEKEQGERVKKAKNKKNSGKISTETNGNLIVGKISHPYEIGYREVEVEYSCNIIFTCSKKIKVSYDVFNPSAWPSVFGNLPETFPNCSMIFNPEEEHSKTGQEIESIIAPITVAGSPFNIHKVKDQYDIITTNITTGPINRIGQGTYSFVDARYFTEESPSYDKLKMKSRVNLVGNPDKFHYNLAFKKNSNDIALFLSYDLKEQKDGKAEGSYPLTEIAYTRLKSKDRLTCKNCLVIDTSMIAKPADLGIFTGDAKIYKKGEGNRPSDYKELNRNNGLNVHQFGIETGTRMRNTLKEGASPSRVIRRGLAEVRANDRNYIIVDRDLIYCTDRLTNVKLVRPQSKVGDSTLYAMTSKVWIEMSPEIFELALNKVGVPAKPDDNVRIWIQDSLKNGSKKFNDLLKKSLDEVLRTNGQLDANIIKLDDVGVSLLVLEGKRGDIKSKWSENGPKTFIVQNAGKSALIKGKQITFDLKGHFGDHYASLEGYFETFTKLKSFFKRTNPPALRNFILARLLFESRDDLSNFDQYYGVHLGVNKILLAKHILLGNSYGHYAFLKVESGRLSTEIQGVKVKIDNKPRLFTHEFELHLDQPYSEGVLNLRPPKPLGTDIAQWRNFFSNYTDNQRYYLSMPQEAPTQHVSALRHGGSIEYWWWPIGSSTKSDLKTRKYKVNKKLYLSNSNIPGTNKSASGFRYFSNNFTEFSLLPLLDQSIYQSESWFDNNVEVNPLVFLIQK